MNDLAARVKDGLLTAYDFWCVVWCVVLYLGLRVLYALLTGFTTRSKETHRIYLKNLTWADTEGGQ